MKRPFPLLVVGLALGLGGCEDAYSPSVRYGVRHDPVLMVAGAQLAPERHEPDRPGQLPLLNISGIFDPRNPLNETKVREKIEQAELLRDPTKIADADRKTLADGLEAMFGTPAQPKVRGYDTEAKKVTELSADEQNALKLDDKTLAEGSRLYRIHCVHCHGVPGDGRGPTSQWVNPHPRDFREGLFKFQSVDQLKAGANSPPRRGDLLRTLQFGLEGSAMPAFTLLTDNEREHLVSYVIHLSMRGKAEFDTVKGAFDWDKASKTLKLKSGEDLGVGSLTEYLGVMQGMNLDKWRKSQLPENAIQVAAFPFDPSDTAALQKSVERGHQMFIGKATDDKDEKMQKWAKAANCVSCHTDYGRQSMFRWDDWATLVRPNNLTNGVYRAGRRPVDFYYRIHSGINGSGMANFGSSLPTEAIWDLVNFVRTLPYPTMRQQFAINLQ